VVSEGGVPQASRCWRYCTVGELNSERADDGENTLNGLVEKADATSAPVPSLLLQRKLHLFRN
jgi:hypothetical protein